MRRFDYSLRRVSTRSLRRNKSKSLTFFVDFAAYSTEDASWVALSPEASTWEGSLASKAWRLLERHLHRHDSAPVYRYRLVVLERVLATNRDGKIPTFLTDFLLRNQPQSLLKTLIRFDRLSEAFRYSLETIQVRVALFVHCAGSTR